MPVCLNRETSIMRGKPKNPPVTAVGQWIDAGMEECGIRSLRDLQELSGVSQPRLTQIRNGDTTKRDMIERIAPHITPPGKDPDQVLAAGLDAAAKDQFRFGDENEDIAYLDGLPPSEKARWGRLAREFQKDDTEDNAGNVGKRAE